MTPLLFEVCSGTLDLRHCSFPVCAFLRTTRFVEATVQGIDLERRVVHLAAPGWSRRLRIMIDWTFSLLFRPDIVKISLDNEAALLLREVAAESSIHPNTEIRNSKQFQVTQ